MTCSPPRPWWPPPLAGAGCTRIIDAVDAQGLRDSIRPRTAAGRPRGRQRTTARTRIPGWSATAASSPRCARACWCSTSRTAAPPTTRARPPSGRSPPWRRARATTPTPTRRAALHPLRDRQGRDLTDTTPPSGWPNPSSTRLPTAPTGEFDVLALFSSTFAALYGFPDPNTPTRALSLCELFERGIDQRGLDPGRRGGPAPRAAEPGAQAELRRDRDRGPGQLRAQRGRRRDAAGRHHLRRHRAPRAPGRRARAGLRSGGPRLGDRSDVGGAARRCAPTRSRSSTATSTPASASPSASWGMICDQAAGIPCVNYPTPTRATGHAGQRHRLEIDPFLQGCGSTEFPPNARWRGDISMNNTMVQSRCEHFGLRDGPDGSDAYEPVHRRQGRRAGADVPRLRRRLADLLATEHPGVRQPRPQRRRHADEELVAAAVLLEKVRPAGH